MKFCLFFKRKLISKQQHGFLNRHSTTTQLFECVNDWSIVLDDKCSVDISYVDFSRAFDSVVHFKLICKLASYGIADDLLVWLKTFLLSRSQCVVINSFVSLPSDVLSGVPQGSVIGPLLENVAEAIKRPLAFLFLLFKRMGFTRLAQSSHYPNLQERRCHSFLQLQANLPNISLVSQGCCPMHLLSGHPFIQPVFKPG